MQAVLSQDYAFTRWLFLSPLCVHFNINFLNWVLHRLESLVLESYFGIIIIMIIIYNIMIIIYNIYKYLYSLCSRFTYGVSSWILMIILS